MNWYKHDTNAITDAKIRKLIIKYGAEGYAIYFHCLELIASDVNENNITFVLEHDAEIIADNLKIKSMPDCSSIDKVCQIMNYMVDLNLFQRSNDKIFCFKLLKRLDSSMTSSPKFRNLITIAKDRHDKVMISHDVVMQDKIRTDKIRKDKIRKDKIRKDNSSFDRFWNLYDKKIAQGKCIDKWNKINPDIHPVIFSHLKQYIKATPDKQFRLNPVTYLNNESWNNEVIFPKEVIEKEQKEKEQRERESEIQRIING